VTCVKTHLAIRTAALVAIVGGVCLVGGAAHGARSPKPVTLPTDGVYQVPGLFITDRGKTVLSPELPLFSARCSHPADPIDGTLQSTPLRGKPVRFSIRGHMETTDGLTITWFGTHTQGSSGPYTGTGTGTWQASALPAACRHGGAATASGTFTLTWVPTKDGVTQRFVFAGFSP